MSRFAQRSGDGIGHEHEVEELCERPFPIGVNLDDMVEALSGERNATVETIGFGVVAQKHEHGTVAGRVGQTGAGIDVDLPSRKAATNRRNPADLIELLHPPTGACFPIEPAAVTRARRPGRSQREGARGESKSESRRSAIWVAASLTVRVMPDTKPSRSSSTRTGTMAAPSPAAGPASGSTGTTGTPHAAAAAPSAPPEVTTTIA